VKHTRAKEGLGVLCGLFGYTRQAYYQQKIRNSYHAIKGEIVLEKVKEQRKAMPRVGARKLLYLLQKDGIYIGRDKLFELLGNNNMLVRKRKHKVYTTISKHWLKKYPNLIKDIEVLKPNKLWVSDITYVIIDNDFAYLFLITDAYSKKILGHFLSETLEADGGIEALRMALRGIEWHKRAGMIHHSDRGVQYCSNNYVKLLEDSKMLISMTENGDPYENAIAERVNGVLKDEWIHNETYNSFEQAKKRIAEIIEIYNTQRPHLSCDMLTPEQAHKCSGKLKKHWKKYKKNYNRDEKVFEVSNESMNKKAEGKPPAHAIVSGYSLPGCSSAVPDSASPDMQIYIESVNKFQD
jgi:transposase InsO family protein